LLKPQGMKITDFFLAQLEREHAISRRVLSHVPEGRSDWKPHDRSMALGALGTLVATMPAWIGMVVTRDELDVHPKDGEGFRPPAWRTNAQLLEQFEHSAAEARAAVAATDDAFLATPWKLLAAGKVVDERPRHEVIADTLCHAAHHRGQLAVYLRLLGAIVPSIYGPSADDRVF
jgi:uncharacterized damage-inducible protein DinB